MKLRANRCEPDESSPGRPDNDSQGYGARSPVPSQNNLEEERGDDDTHAQGIVEELLYSPRQYIELDSDGHGGNSQWGGGEVGKCHNDEANQVAELSCRSSAKTSQRRKRTVPLVRERVNWSTMPMRASRQVTSPQPRLLPSPRVDIATRSCSPQTSSSGSKAGSGSNINYGSSANMTYQITDLTHCHVPKGSSIDSKMSIAASQNCFSIQWQYNGPGPQAPRWGCQRHPHDRAIAGFMVVGGIPA